MDVVRRGDEPCPESGDGGSIEGEKMPECEGIRVVADCFEWRFGWGRGGHLD